MVLDNAFLQVQLANPIEKEAIDGSRLHRKVLPLLELLDQVEDVISVEESMDNDLEMYSCKIDDTKPKHLAVESNSLKIAPKRVNCLPSNINFLVLEVLHLLNEQSGRAFCVHLHDSWWLLVSSVQEEVSWMKAKCKEHSMTSIIWYPAPSYFSGGLTREDPTRDYYGGLRKGSDSKTH
ncbi:hypothetical protein Sjap_011333 [Stephania japonica]|uniref:Uncharacterized protein n=1 Tax=Stephania japonica TaxID=461633 RepID=A0AAP0JD32_9MAGN